VRREKRERKESEKGMAEGNFPKPRVLCHVCDVKEDTLDPGNYDEGAVCLSGDVFVGMFGKWVYVFDYDVMEANFAIKQAKSGGVVMMTECRMGNCCVDCEYHSDQLGVEYRITETIDVDRYALCVIQNFGVHRGTLKELFEEFMGNRISTKTFRTRVDLTAQLAPSAPCHPQPFPIGRFP